jgi:hypothetical protein
MLAQWNSAQRTLERGIPQGVSYSTGVYCILRFSFFHLSIIPIFHYSGFSTPAFLSLPFCLLSTVFCIRPQLDLFCPFEYDISTVFGPETALRFRRRETRRPCIKQIKPHFPVCGTWGFFFAGLWLGIN